MLKMYSTCTNNNHYPELNSLRRLIDVVFTPKIFSTLRLGGRDFNSQFESVMVLKVLELPCTFTDFHVGSGAFRRTTRHDGDHTI